MSEIILSAKKREITGKENAALREEGLVPAVLYGPEVKENILLTVARNDLQAAFDAVGNSGVVVIDIEGGEKIEVLIHDIEKDPITEFLLHVDLYKFKEGQQITSVTELNFIGEARPVKELGSILVKQRDQLPIRCLAKDLIRSVDVDLAKIQTSDDTITLADLDIPESVTVLIEKDAVIASVTKSRAEKKDKE